MKLSFLLFNIKFVGFGKFVWSLIGFTRTAMVYFHGLKLYTTNITATYICVHPIINSQVLCRYLRQHKQRNFVAYNLTRHLYKYGYAWVRRGVFQPNPHWSDWTYELNILWLCWKEASRLIVLTNPDMLFCSSYIFIYCFWHNLLQVVGMGFLLRILCHKLALCGSSLFKSRAILQYYQTPIVWWVWYPCKSWLWILLVLILTIYFF